MDSDLIRTSLPLRSDAELPPGESQPIVLPGLPMVFTPKCVHRHNRMTIACFMFVVSVGTTLGSLTDLQQLPQRLCTLPARDAWWRLRKLQHSTQSPAVRSRWILFRTPATRTAGQRIGPGRQFRVTVPVPCCCGYSGNTPGTFSLRDRNESLD